MKYRAYSKYQDSGVEWLGNVPEHWVIKRGRFCMKINPRSDRIRALDLEDEISFIPMEAIAEHGGLNLENTRQVGEVGSGYTEFQDGDVIVAKITPCFENYKGAIAEGMVNGAAFGTTELHVLRVSQQLVRRFLFYLTMSSAYRRNGEAEMYGAGGQKRVPPDFNKNFPVPFPPNPEQRLIADFLDSETKKIDTLLSKKHTLIEKLKEKRSALISRTVTRGLPPETARAAGLDTYPKLKPSGVEWLGDVPEHWDIKPMKYVASVITGYAFSSDDFVDDGIPLVRIGDIKKDGNVDLSNAKHLPDEFGQIYKKVMIHGGDIVMAMTGATIGKAGRYESDKPALLNQRVCIFRANRSFDSGFLWYLLNSSFYIEHILLTAFGGAQPNISDKELLDCRVTVPPIFEQTAISAYIEIETDKIDKLVKKTESAIERLQEYRTALITAAVTGKIDVREIQA